MHRGAVPEVLTGLHRGLAIYQMPCPEQRAWGGLLKRRMLRAYGLRGSPSCGAGTTLDLRRAFEILAACPLASIDRTTVNERAVAGCLAPGDGLFIAALKRRPARRGIEIPFLEYDLVAEMRGAPQPETLSTAQALRR